MARWRREPLQCIIIKKKPFQWIALCDLIGMPCIAYKNPVRCEPTYVKIFSFRHLQIKHHLLMKLKSSSAITTTTTTTTTMTTIFIQYVRLYHPREPFAFLHICQLYYNNFKVVCWIYWPNFNNDRDDQKLMALLLLLQWTPFCSIYRLIDWLTNL